MKQKKGDKKSLVKEAINDLTKSLAQLGKQKQEFDRREKVLELNVANARKQQQELQEKIARLMESESKMTEKKKYIETKEEALVDKLNKVKKIKYELEEV